MDLNCLKVFHEACKYKSFTKASQKLFVSQSAVSMQIKKLEQNLEVQLIERNAKTFKLTNEGAELYKMAKDIFEKVSRMENNIQRIIKSKKEKLFIGSNHNIGEPILPTIIKEFTEIEENIEFDIFIKNSATLIKYLKEGTLDIILAEDLNVVDDDIEVVNTNDYPFVIIAPNEVKNYNDLKNIFYLKRNSEQTSIYMKKFEEKIGFKNDKIMNVNGSIETTKRLVAMGVGFALVPYYCVYENIETNDFKILYRFSKSFNKFQIMYMKDRDSHSSLQKFIKFIINKDITKPLKDLKKV